MRGIGGVNLSIDAVLIGGIIYPVESVKELESAKGKRLDGYVTFRPYLIQLDSELGSQGERVVLWHEILHAVIEQTGRSTKKGEEQLLNVLAYGITQVLQDNPMLKTFPRPSFSRISGKINQMVDGE